MLLNCADEILNGGAVLSSHRLDNDTHEEILFFIHLADDLLLSRLYMLNADFSEEKSVTVYIPVFRKCADCSARERFCQSLRERLASLQGNRYFALADYGEGMEKILDTVENSLIYEAE